MTFFFESPEPVIVTSVNWPVLEYLIERFNRSALEGYIVLRRTSLLKDLQLCLTAECNGKTLSLLSEPFGDTLLTESDEREQLIRVVSRFLLKAKHQHAVLFAHPTPMAPNSLSHGFGGGASPPTVVRRDVTNSSKNTERETFDGPAG